MPNHDEKLRHLRLRDSSKESFKSPTSGMRKFKFPERSNKAQHVGKLLREIHEVSISPGRPGNLGTYITIEGKSGYDLKEASLKDKKSGTELLVKGETEDNTKFALLKITPQGLQVFEKKLSQYVNEVNTKSGKAKNNDLIAGIETIKKAVVKDFWVGNMSDLPSDNTTAFWVEVWIAGGTFDSAISRINRDSFREVSRDAGININTDNPLEFTENQVFLIHASVNQLSELISRSDIICELRKPSRVTLHYYALAQPGIINVTSIENNINAPAEDNVRIAIIDTGVSDKHPLLIKVIAPNGLYTIDSSSSLTTDYKGHGTEMAGIAAFGDVTNIISNTNPINLDFSIESVRFKLDTEAVNKILWGSTTQRAVNVTEERNADVNRIFNLSIGCSDSKHNGNPTSWSAAVDLLCFNNGLGRLMTIAAGNVRPIDKENYFNRNLSSEIDEPSQALNAICVGGYTKLVEANLQPNFEVIAPKDGLSPHSRSGPAKYAIKPEIVCEAGNAIFDGDISETYEKGISLLTTNSDFTSNPLTNTCGTSAAAPQAARMLAIIWANNPEYKPATIRGLLIHSANWTETMKIQFDENKTDLLRTCGYGVPNLEMACHSAKSSVTLIAEDEIQCAYEETIESISSFGKILRKKEKKREMSFYELPWPQDLLLELGEEKVEVRITLSYFIEPNPRQSSENYEGAGLSWEMQGPNESKEDFLKRINKIRRTENEKGFKIPIDWEIGSSFRNRGTVQSDRCTMNAADLSSCGHIAVFPKHGWWKNNPKKRPNPVIPFSLIISVISESQDINLYVPIQQMISVEVESGV